MADLGARFLVLYILVSILLFVRIQELSHKVGGWLRSGTQSGSYIRTQPQLIVFRSDLLRNVLLLLSSMNAYRLVAKSSTTWWWW